MKVNMTPNPLDVVTIHASQGDSEARQWEFELHNNGELIDTSDVKEQLVFKAYKGGTEQILPENTSTPTTSPFFGDIRYPQGLLSDQEFTYRQSPTEEDGLAFIENIKGNTIKFNQLCNYEFGKSLVDFTLSNHELTFDFTSTTNTNWWNYQIYSQLEYEIQANHKYFIRFWAKSDYPIGNIVFNGDKNVSAGETIGGYIKRYSLFTNATANKVRFYLRPLLSVTANTLTMASVSGNSSIALSNFNSGGSTYGNYITMLVNDGGDNNLHIQNNDSSGTAKNYIDMSAANNMMHIWSRSDLYLQSDGAVRIYSSNSQDITLNASDDIHLTAGDKIYWNGTETVFKSITIGSTTYRILCEA